MREARALGAGGFRIGANLPWARYGGDFGASAWQPAGGLAANADEASRVARTLGDLRSAGVTWVRWFLLCDGRAGVRYDVDGCPRALDDAFWADVNRGLTLADEAGVDVLFSLFDFHWCRPRHVVRGVACGGRTATIRDARMRAALMAHVVEPIARTVGSHPRVAAWEVMNEPEWATLGLGGWRPDTCVRTRTMRAFLAAVVATFRRHTATPLTVGSASARWLRLVRGLDLDFYQVHWYDRFERHAPLGRPVHAWGLDRPVVLGEYPTRGSRRDVEGILSRARDAGYAGALYWSALADDAASDPGYAVDALRDWMSRHA